MALIETWLRCELGSAVQVQYLNGNLFSQDNQANLIGVRVYENGEPADLSGSVSANVIRADGGTVSVAGTLQNGNECYVILPQAAYAVPGAVSVIIKITSSGQVTTLAAAISTVYTSSTETAVDPGTIIPSVQTLISAIETAVASIPADYSSLWTSLAPAYSTSSTYAVGSYVTYNGGLYRCTTAITSAESWTSGHWTAAKLGPDVSDVKSAFNTTLTPISWSPTLKKGQYIKGADGTTGSSNKYARTNAIQAGYGYKIAINLTDTNYKYYVSYYDGTGAFDGTGYIGYSGSSTTGISYIPSNAIRFGVSFSRVDDASLTDSDITAISAALSAYAATDTSLSKNGLAADAKITGNKINEINTIIGENITILSGSYVNRVWSDSNYAAFVHVYPGSRYSITAGSTDAIYYGLKSVTIPPTVGDSAALSDASDWNVSAGARTITAGATATGYIPNDVNYLYFFLGTNTNYARKPTAIILNGINIYDPVYTDIHSLANAKEEKTHAESEFARIDATIGELITELSGQYSSQSWVSSGYSAFVPVYPGSRYSITAGSVEAQYYGLKSATIPPTVGDSVVLSDESGWNSTIRTVSAGETENGYIPDDVHYLWFYYGTNTSYARKPSKIVINGVNVFDSVSDNITDVAYIIENRERIVNKTIAFFGDSITAGVATSKCFHQYVHDKYGFICLNYGYGGSGYYRSYTGTSSGKLGLGVPGMGVAITSENAFTPNNVVARLAELNPNTVDGIVIFAGTNDWGNNVSVDNFISGMESAFDYCNTNLTNVPVLVMTPVHRRYDTVANTQGKTLREYCDIIINECKKYGMAYVDTMTMSGLNPDNEANRLFYFEANPDSGLHPSAEGHKRIASVISRAIIEVTTYSDFS